MRFTSPIITKISLCFLAILLIMTSLAHASEMDEQLTVGIISVKTQYTNPLLLLEREFQAATELIYEGLFAIGEEYEIIPKLAESYHTEDYKTWTIKLRDDVFFHDGTPLTAYDVAGTLNEILRLAKDEAAENKGVYSSMQYLIKKINANNATTLVIESSRQYYGFLYALTFPVLKESEVGVKYPAGTGPYRLEKFSPGDYLYLSVNENWWQDLPYVREINFILHKTNKELISAFEFNQVDTVITRSVSAAQYSISSTSVNMPYRTRQLETFLMNNTVRELKDERVRKAIRYAIDVDHLAQIAYFDNVSRTDTPIPADTWLYNGTTQVDGESAYAYNPEKAKELLAEVGWEDANENGFLDRVVDGEEQNLRLRFYVYEESDNTVRVQVAQAISEMLAKVGIDAPVVIMSFNAVKEKLKAVNFDLVLGAYQMDAVVDPGFLLMHPNVGNYCRYNSSEMNDLFKSLRKAKDKDTYKHTLYKIQDRFAQDCPFICLYYRNGSILSRKMFTNERILTEPNLLSGVEKIGTE